MKKRNKAYRPRQVIPDVMQYVKTGMAPLSVAATVLNRVQVANHGAMDSLTKGKGTRQDTITLGHMLITAKALAKHSIGRDWLPELEEAEAALKAVQARGGRYVMRAAEITALNLALEVHDAQLDGCTVKQMEDAITAAKDAILHNHEVLALTP